MPLSDKTLWEALAKGDFISKTKDDSKIQSLCSRNGMPGCLGWLGRD